MRSEIGSGPFRPGTGRPPPYLAGREEERYLFLLLLANLGFVWRTQPRPVSEPGLPGLMDYLLREVTPRYDPDGRRSC